MTIFKIKTKVKIKNLSLCFVLLHDVIYFFDE